MSIITKASKVTEYATADSTTISTIELYRFSLPTPAFNADLWTAKIRPEMRIAVIKLVAMEDAKNAVLNLTTSAVFCAAKNDPGWRDKIIWLLTVKPPMTD